MRADAALGGGGDGQAEDDGPVLEKLLEGVVKNSAHGRPVAPHHAFETVDRADHVAFVDHIVAADADKQVFRVIGHADDLVRDDLSE